MAKNTKRSMASRSAKSKTKSQSKMAKWIILTSFALVSASAIGWYVWQSDLQFKPVSTPEQLMPIRLVEIQGELIRVEKEQILNVLRSLSRESDADQQTLNFLTADLRDVEVELESLAWIYRVNIRRIWPDKLILELEEQQAVAVWNDKQLVNKYGNLFKPEVIEEYELPRLTGPEAELSFLLTTFAELQGQFEAAELQLAELHMSERRSWQMKLTNDITLDVGRKDLAQRVNRFIDLYPLLVSENPQAIERVDLRYDTGLAVLRAEPETRQASL